ncbi:MAG: ferredoxin--NADP reductase [Candidatus Levyibacteriota bacterium]
MSFRVTRNPAFRFTPGHYARVGLADPPLETVYRPLSVASAPADSHLEFFCSLIPGGQLSARVAALRIGEPVEVERASFGFLTVDSLSPGADLWLLATGTGIAPFLSMLRDPQAWQDFAHLIVVQSVRHAAELAYADEIRRLADRPRAPTAPRSLRYLPVVTRELRALLGERGFRTTRRGIRGQVAFEKYW